MGAIGDHPAFEFANAYAEHHWGEEKAEEKLAGMHRHDDVLTNGYKLAGGGAKAYDSFAKHDYLGGAKSTATFASGAASLLHTLGGHADLLGPGLGVVAKGLGNAEDFNKVAHPSGEHTVPRDETHERLETAANVFSTGGTAFSVANKATDIPVLKQLSGEANAVGHGLEAYDHFRNAFGHYHEREPKPEDAGKPKDKRRTIDKQCDEAVAGAGSVFEMVGDAGEMVGGPHGKMMKAASTGAGLGLKVGHKGVEMSREWGLHGKDKDGYARGVDDMVADKGTQAHDRMQALLGDSTAANVVSHIYGGGEMLNQLPLAGVEAAGLGIAGYATDAYHTAGDAYKTAKGFATNPTVQSLVSKIYFGQY